MTNGTRKWVRAGLETLIHGATAALSSTLAAASIDAKDWALFSAHFWELALATFAANGGVRFLQWWSANPLPENGTSPPVPGYEPPKISLNPISKVVPAPPPGQPPAP